VGHQFAFPTIAAMAGTVMVRTTKVSINRDTARRTDGANDATADAGA
jgi:hypothetical protein